MSRVGRMRAARTEEKGAATACVDESLSHLIEIPLGPPDRALADWYQAVFLPLSLAHEYHAALSIEIGEIESDELHAAEARRVTHLEDGPVAACPRPTRSHSSLSSPRTWNRSRRFRR